MKRALLFLSALPLLFAPSLLLACACGCGIFDVGTSSMLPEHPGGTAWVEYDFMNQDINWNGNSVASESANSDKRIRSEFYNVGAEYMFNRSWGAEIEVPYTQRDFRTMDDSGSIASYNHGEIGDVRVEGIYSGFSADMSTGLIVGAKLPTGDYTATGFDRDTQIGTGSTDSILGGYHLGVLGFGNRLNWFAQGTWEHPLIISAGYRPGDEIDAATGVYYDLGSFGIFTNIAPIFQVLGSGRFHDSGYNADGENTGYERAYLSPGVEFSIGKAKLYADVELPVYQYMEGEQLVAPELVKVVASYDF